MTAEQTEWRNISALLNQWNRVYRQAVWAVCRVCGWEGKRPRDPFCPACEEDLR